MNILILSFSNISRDPRVLRQIDFVRSNGTNNLYLSGLDYLGKEPFIPLLNRQRTLLEKIGLLFTNIFRFNKLKEKWFLKLVNVSKLQKLCSDNKIDYILANDLETWPVAFQLKKVCSNAKIILDAHEYYPRHFEDNLIWRIMHASYYNFVCDQYIPMTDEIITVADGLAREYKARFHKNCHVVFNSPDFEDSIKPVALEENKIKLIHHGIANRSRKLEKMIRLMDHLDSRFELYLMLVPTDLKYLKHLKELSQGKKIYFLDPVPTTDISTYINRFDLGLFLLEPINFNYENALPNKFFEFIQGRLGIAIGPSKEMKTIVEQNNMGVVSEDFEEISLARSLNSLTTNEVMQFKINSDHSAQRYSSLQNQEVFKTLFQ